MPESRCHGPRSSQSCCFDGDAQVKFFSCATRSAGRAGSPSMKCPKCGFITSELKVQCMRCGSSLPGRKEVPAHVPDSTPAPGRPAARARCRSAGMAQTGDAKCVREFGNEKAVDHAPESAQAFHRYAVRTVSEIETRPGTSIPHHRRRRRLLSRRPKRLLQRPRRRVRSCRRRSVRR